MAACAPGRAGNALTWRAQPSHRRQEAPKHAPALFGDPHTCGPILGEAVLLQVLKGEPIQLANVKVAFSDLLQGPLSDGLSLISAAFSMGADLSRPTPLHSVAAWRSQAPGGARSI